MSNILPDDVKRKKPSYSRHFSTHLCSGGFEKIRAAVSFCFCDDARAIKRAVYGRMCIKTMIMQIKILYLYEIFKFLLYPVVEIKRKDKRIWI